MSELVELVAKLNRKGTQQMFAAILNSLGRKSEYGAEPKDDGNKKLHSESGEGGDAGGGAPICASPCHPSALSPTSTTPQAEFLQPGNDRTGHCSSGSDSQNE
jgi:hypothetical protein